LGVISVDYDENGNVVSATVIDSSGHAVLDEAVLQTVREQYRLRDNGGSGSTVLSIDMTIDGSDFNRDARERGDRRAIEIPAPPVADEPAPTNTAVEAIVEPKPSVEPSPNPIPDTNSTAPTTTPLPASETPVEAVTPAEPEVIPTTAIPPNLPEAIPVAPESPQPIDMPPTYQAPQPVK
jgi:TonB family protein